MPLSHHPATPTATLSVKASVGTLLLCALSACNTVAVGHAGVTPSTAPARFQTIANGSVSAARVPQMVDCAVDALDSNRLQVVGVVRQLRRANGHRVDEWNAGAVFTSVEIEDNGAVKAVAWSTGTALISTKNVAAAVEECIRANA